MRTSLVPHVSMEFRTFDEAWAFWLSYGGQKGFDIMKRYTNERPSDSNITSSRFVYANEGHRLQDKMDHLTKFPRTETRIDYQVHTNLKMDSEKGNLEVTKVILEHNQLLTNRY